MHMKTHGAYMMLAIYLSYDFCSISPTQGFISANLEIPRIIIVSHRLLMIPISSVISSVLCHE